MLGLAPNPFEEKFLDVAQARPLGENLDLKEPLLVLRGAALRALGAREAHGQSAEAPPFARVREPRPAKPAKRRQRLEIVGAYDAERLLLGELRSNYTPPSPLGEEDRAASRGEGEDHDERRQERSGDEKYARVVSMSRPICAVSSIMLGNVRSSRARSKNSSRTRSPYTSEEKSRM